ncbi:MAG: ribonuclease J [Firmicutes bacterium]|nr:ribonuclease J [Bacillota bacterium]
MNKMALDILNPQSIKEHAEKKAVAAVSGKANLKVIFLGGVGEIGKNMTLLEFGNDILIIDTGLAFPSDTMPGIDKVVQDLSYLNTHKAKVKGIVLTHGHLDHIGALPYVLQTLNLTAPVYGSRFTLSLVENQLREYPGLKIKAVSVKAKSIVKVGCYDVEFVHMNHSIPGSFALSINTPVGTVFHSGDFKIDHTPVDAHPADLSRMAEIGKKGVRLLMCESTNVERSGTSRSETEIGFHIDELFHENDNKRIFVSTFASNIHRVQQLLELAEKYKRKVVFGGRSMINNMDTALKIGEMKATKSNIIEIAQMKNFPDKELLIILTGSQGEAMSALNRMANGEFNKVEIGSNDLIILSSHAIPGNESSLNNMINNLFKRGADVAYEDEKNPCLHASGHAYQEELKVVHALLKPQFFIPVHGEYKHLKKHADLAKQLGMNERCVVRPELGDVIEINTNFIKRTGSVPAGIKFIDGAGVGEADNYVLRDRMQLAEDGICVVGILLNKATGELVEKPTIVTRGLFYNNENEFINECKEFIPEILSGLSLKDLNEVSNEIRHKLSNFVFKRFKRKPVVLTIINVV